MATSDLFPQLRVLLVDDEPFILNVTSKVLGSLHIDQVLTAENGADAITQLEKNKVDLLITDIQMPQMNGIELIKRIRTGRTSADRGLRTVVVTSFSNTEVLGSCLALDINGFLVKPVSSTSAADKIQQAIDEQTNLRSKDDYAKVKSDLATLAEAGREEEAKAHASTPHKPAVSDEPGSALIKLTRLKPGMELSEDLRTQQGIKLLSAGHLLSEGLVNRINELASIIETTEIRVKLPAE